MKLTRLSEPPYLNEWIQNVTLPRNCASTGIKCMITGWGRMNEYTNSSQPAIYSDKLRAPDKPMFSCLYFLRYHLYRILYKGLPYKGFPGTYSR